MKEVRHPLSPTRPIWVRTKSVLHGGPVPQPSVPHPEWHPYCEVNFSFAGKKLQYVGIKSRERHAGDVLLIGPGTPHYALELSYPQRSATVFFLPLLLLEMGPEGDGARLLARCCESKNISEQILKPSHKVRKKLAGLFDEITREFEYPQYGSELRLRSLLIEILVTIARREKPDANRQLDETTANWMQLQRPLRYAHEHYAEPIYVKELAAASGMSVTRLQHLFHATVGISCMQYIQWYRLTHALALLSMPEARITEVAHEVGFDTLSHFNSSFRKFLGVSPSDYIRKRCGNRTQLAPK
jgi:AraC-like DNA-binding protein